MKCVQCLIELTANMDFKWRWFCPNCNHKNFDHPVYFNCEKCHCSPKMAPCPNCKKLIDLDIFLFNQSLPTN